MPLRRRGRVRARHSRGPRAACHFVVTLRRRYSSQHHARVRRIRALTRAAPSARRNLRRGATNVHVVSRRDYRGQTFSPRMAGTDGVASLCDLVGVMERFVHSRMDCALVIGMVMCATTAGVLWMRWSRVSFLTGCMLAVTTVNGGLSLVAVAIASIQGRVTQVQPASETLVWLLVVALIVLVITAVVWWDEGARRPVDEDDAASVIDAAVRYQVDAARLRRLKRARPGGGLPLQLLAERVSGRARNVTVAAAATAVIAEYERVLGLPPFTQ